MTVSSAPAAGYMARPPRPVRIGLIILALGDNWAERAGIIAAFRTVGGLGG